MDSPNPGAQEIPRRRRHYSAAQIESKRKYKQKLKIKLDACNASIGSIKSLLPGVDGKTDKAATLEVAVKYIKSLQETLGSSKEAEFLKSIEK